MNEPADRGLPPHLAALLTPRAYPHEVGEIRLVETHISWVLLTGGIAYKIKRPVRYPFVDLRSAERRRFLCEEEVRLNRRFAPELYEAVVPITVEAGNARIGGSGEAVEHAVRMRQFARSEELAVLVAESRIGPDELRTFGRYLFGIHRELPAEVAGPFSTVDAVRASLLANVEQLESIAARSGTALPDASFRPRIESLIGRHARTIEGRKASGHVRECHGDLHCRNVVRHAGRLVAFDCLEFEEAFRWIDVAQEIAFLWMDLTARGAPAHAAAFLGAYLEAGGDYEACRLLRLYGAHCALVRAKVAATGTPSPTDFAAYAGCARQLLGTDRRPTLVLTSGFSGSGKTWLARRLAPEIGAIHLRSDVERKRLAGVDPLAGTASPVGGGAYASDMNARTYRRLAASAADALAGGFNVIVDATFQRREDRARFVTLAREMNARLALVRCGAPDAVLEARIRERTRSAHDASEADLAVLDWQRTHFESIGPEEGLAVIDADTTRDSVVSDVGKALDAFGLSR
jgi:aminoglycoside phosphotransferase family enzyme/predicted kinase